MIQFNDRREVSSMKLESRIALITGGASGIGKAIALRFSREGAGVAVADINIEEGKKTCNEIENFDRSAMAVEVDVSDEESVQHAVQEVLKRFGRIDILVNNAGISWVKPFFEVSNEDWDRMIRIHLYGCFYFSQTVSREMVVQGNGGKILNISSITGFRGSTGRGAYGAAKAGMINFTRYLAVELAPHNINVNAIAPGPILTPLIETLWEQRDRHTFGLLEHFRFEFIQPCVKHEYLEALLLLQALQVNVRLP